MSSKALLERSYNKHVLSYNGQCFHLAESGSSSRQPDLIDIYLSGAKAEDILAEVVCGESTFQGAKVHIPANRFQRLLHKLRGIEADDFWTTYVFVSFLYHRCPTSFVQMWKHENNEQFNKLFTKALGRYEFSYILAVLNEGGFLEEDFRQTYVKWAEEAILENAECQFLRRKVRALILDAEINRIVARVRDELLPTLTDKLLAHEDTFDPEEVEPDDHFSEWRDNLESFVELYDDEEISESFCEALDLIDDLEGRLSRVKEKHEKKKEEEEAQQLEEHSDDEYWHSEQESESASESFMTATQHGFYRLSPISQDMQAKGVRAGGVDRGGSQNRGEPNLGAVL